MTNLGQRGILKIRMRGFSGPTLAEIKEFLEISFDVDVEISGVYLPVPLITSDGVDHGVGEVPDVFKFEDEKREADRMISIPEHFTAEEKKILTKSLKAAFRRRPARKTAPEDRELPMLREADR